MGLQGERRGSVVLQGDMRGLWVFRGEEGSVGLQGERRGLWGFRVREGVWWGMLTARAERWLI